MAANQSYTAEVLNRAEALCSEKMRGDNLPELVIQNFLRLLRQVASGATGIIEEEAISSVPELPSYDRLAADPAVRSEGENALSTLAVCKLNGGLGTSMGLTAAKSLLPVKEGLSFNDINAAQVISLCRRTGKKLVFMNMTSFSTDADVAAAFDKYNEIEKLFFQQHKHPKVSAEDLAPAKDSDEELNWNPPGHGDLYPALVTSETLEALLVRGIQYLFVSNADNSAASPDPVILGYMTQKKLPFIMEVTRRTHADRKGGHLALRKSDGRLVLREAAQAPDNGKGEPCAEFQDTDRYRFFNTNSLWIDLHALNALLDKNGGILPLPLIRNTKTLNPRDSKSPKVFQLETAMGAAIELFSGASALDVPRTRFMPVKTNWDLLLLRSDLFELTDEGTLRNVSGHLPQIFLDSAYKLIDDFEKRFIKVPSLKHASRFEVHGDVSFSSPLIISGAAVIRDLRAAKVEPALVPASIGRLENEEVLITDDGIEVKSL